MATAQTNKSNGKNGKHKGSGKTPATATGKPIAAPKPHDPGKPTVSAKKQTSIPGTGAPGVPDAVQEAADACRAKSLALSTSRKAYSKAAGHLEMLMKQHKVELVGGIDDAGNEFEYECKPGEAKLVERTKSKAAN